MVIGHNFSHYWFQLNLCKNWDLISTFVKKKILLECCHCIFFFAYEFWYILKGFSTLKYFSFYVLYFSKVKEKTFNKLNCFRITWWYMTRKEKNISETKYMYVKKTTFFHNKVIDKRYQFHLWSCQTNCKKNIIMLFF